jgi:hypothetical protein
MVQHPRRQPAIFILVVMITWNLMKEIVDYFTEQFRNLALATEQSHTKLQSKIARFRVKIWNEYLQSPN